MLSKQSVKPVMIGAAAVTAGAATMFVVGGLILRRIKGETSAEIARRITLKRNPLEYPAAPSNISPVDDAIKEAKGALLTDSERVLAEQMAGSANTSIIGDDA